MPLEVIMPKVDMDMATGKITSWYVDEGEIVETGAPLFEIETDKAAMEVESPGAGTLHHRAPEGTEVPIGQTVAWLYSEGEEVGPPPESTPVAAPEKDPPSRRQPLKQGAPIPTEHMDRSARRPLPAALHGMQGWTWATSLAAGRAAASKGRTCAAPWRPVPPPRCKRAPLRALQ